MLGKKGYVVVVVVVIVVVRLDGRGLDRTTTFTWTRIGSAYV